MSLITFCTREVCNWNTKGSFFTSIVESVFLDGHLFNWSYCDFSIWKFYELASAFVFALLLPNVWSFKKKIIELYLTPQLGACFGDYWWNCGYPAPNRLPPASKISGVWDIICFYFFQRFIFPTVHSCLFRLFGLSSYRRDSVRSTILFGSTPHFSRCIFFLSGCSELVSSIILCHRKLSSVVRQCKRCLTNIVISSPSSVISRSVF